MHSVPSADAPLVDYIAIQVAFSSYLKVGCALSFHFEDAHP